MTPDYESDCELPIVAEQELRLTSSLSPAERADLLRICQAAIGDHSERPGAGLAPVEFSDELFRDELEMAQAKHLERAKQVQVERAAHPPSIQQIEDLAAPLVAPMQWRIRDYVDNYGPIDIREIGPDE